MTQADWKTAAAEKYADGQCSKEDARDWDMYFRAYEAALESPSCHKIETRTSGDTLEFAPSPPKETIRGKWVPEKQWAALEAQLAIADELADAQEAFDALAGRVETPTYEEMGAVTSRLEAALAAYRKARGK